MKRLTAITALCTLFTSAFVAGKGTPGAAGCPDSLRSVWLYTEGIKQNAIQFYGQALITPTATTRR